MHNKKAHGSFLNWNRILVNEELENIWSIQCFGSLHQSTHSYMVKLIVKGTLKGDITFKCESGYIT